MRAMHGFLGLTVVAFLCGCGTGITPDSKNLVTVPAVQGIHGLVRGGQQPVSDATIQLWSVGTTGYGSAGSSLLTTTVTTSDGTGLMNSNANAGNSNNSLPAGSFTITGDYTCPANDPYVYITASGGNPGLTSGTNNSSIFLVATLADCETLLNNGASTYINIDEATTVAAAYALAQFINPQTGAIGSYSAANAGLQTAFATVNNMVSTSTGSVLTKTPNGNGAVPQTEIDTIANILAPCVNSNGSSPNYCATLFGDLQASSGYTPSNTLLAALSIALHPGYNVSALYGLATGVTPFQPALTSAPNDFTVALSYNDGSTNPSELAIDYAGDVWVANSASGGTTSRLSELNPLGVPINGSPFSSNLNNALALAIDQGGNVWVANAGNSTVVGYQSNGSSFTTLNGNGVSSPDGLAVDSNNFLWIANSGNNSVSEYNINTQNFISPSSGYTGGGMTSPNGGIAVDWYGNAWVSNAYTVTELNQVGTPSAGSPYSSGGITDPRGIAIDSSNNVWINNNPSGTVSELSNSGTALSGSGYTGGGLGPGNGIAIDGAGDVWTADRTLNRISELNSSGTALSPAAGYQGGGLNTPKWLAIDGSGNIWVANGGTTTTNGVTTTISEFVGLAAPTVTPIAISSEFLQQRPGATIPIIVLTQSIPAYVSGVTYSAQLMAAGGNSDSYVWSVASGSLPSPLTLSSSGLINGATSLTGSYSFTAQVCDAGNPSNCNTQALTLSADSALPARGNESALTGSFAFEFEGYKNGSLGAGQVAGSDIIGSFVFNGAGGVSGELDTNNKTSSSLTTTAFTGYYTFGSDRRGIIDIVPTASGKPLELAFSASNFNGSNPQTLRFIEFDDTVPATGGNNFAIGSGVAKLQTSSAFAASTMNQTFVFGLQGETPCSYIPVLNTNCLQNVQPYGPLSAVGEFTGNASQGITSGEEDVAGVNSTYNLIGLSGSYTNPDTYGRGTLTLTPTGTLYPYPPSHFVYYVVNTGEMYVMSSDGHLTNSMLIGDVLAQSSGLGGASLTGNFVAWEESPSGGDGISTFPSSIDSSLIYLTPGSGNTIAVTIDDNSGSQGTIQQENPQGPFTYAIDSKGRMTISQGGNNPPVFYMANTAQGFGTEQPTSSDQGGPALITVQQQTSGTFGCAATTATESVANPPQPVPVGVSSGYGNLNTTSILLDHSEPSGELFLAQPASITCSQDSLTSSTGRLTETFTESLGPFVNTGIEVLYPIVPNSKYVLMDLDPSDNQPEIYMLEK